MPQREPWQLHSLQWETTGLWALGLASLASVIQFWLSWSQAPSGHQLINHTTMESSTLDTLSIGKLGISHAIGPPFTIWLFSIAMENHHF